ncbi:TlpA family protein disulfide reductase, partial [Roseiconus lacunae]
MLDTPTGLVSVGDYVTDFDLPTIDGNSFSLAQCRGKVTVINFFATSCEPCLLELPHIQDIWEENR